MKFKIRKIYHGFSKTKENIFSACKLFLCIHSQKIHFRFLFQHCAPTLGPGFCCRAAVENYAQFRVKLILVQFLPFVLAPKERYFAVLINFTRLDFLCPATEMNNFLKNCGLLTRKPLKYLVFLYYLIMQRNKAIFSISFR